MKMKLHINVKRPGPSNLKQEGLKILPIWVYVKQVIPGARPFLTPGQFEEEFSR